MNKDNMSLFEQTSSLIEVKAACTRQKIIAQRGWITASLIHSACNFKERDCASQCMQLLESLCITVHAASRERLCITVHAAY